MTNETKKQLKITGIAFLAWLTAYGLPSIGAYFIFAEGPALLKLFFAPLYFFFTIYMWGTLLIAVGIFIFNLTFGRWMERIAES